MFMHNYIIKFIYLFKTGLNCGWLSADFTQVLVQSLHLLILTSFLHVNNLNLHFTKKKLLELLDLLKNSKKFVLMY